MKQKNNASEPVAKDFLKKELSKLATKDDLKNVEKSLRAELLRLENRMEGFETRMDRSDENAKQYKDEILTKLDEVMGELQTMREENTIGAYQNSELQKHVDNHEKRIARLEKAKQTA